MYIHHEAKLIYLAHPRTASIATSTTLRKIGFKKLEPPSDHHSQLWDQGTPVTRENRHEWTVFTTVRNHWDAMISWAFKKYRQEPKVWDQRVFDHVFKGNRWVTDDRLWWLHLEEADVVLRYENLQEDFNSVLSKHGIDPPTLLRENVGRERNGKPYWIFYDRQTKKYIYEKFKKEIDQLGYTFEEGKLTDELQNCVGCGLLALDHPMVGIGIHPETEEEGAFPVCARCHLNPENRQRPLKMHFFNVRNADFALSKAFGTEIGLREDE